MALSPEDLKDQSRFTHLLTIPYTDLVSFVLEYIRRRTLITVLFWSLCLIFAGIAICVRVNVSGYFELRKIFIHSLLGAVLLPVIIIPVHELLHLIPYFLSGARKIRVGMDLKQYIFYVTAHRHVATPGQFKVVAVTPFILITIALIFLVLWLPGLWKWSFSLFLFVHTTMCAGDFAMLSFYHVYRKRKVYTWDDANLKEAYFYEEIE